MRNTANFDNKTLLQMEGDLRSAQQSCWSDRVRNNVATDIEQ
jgi:hypothetical protein